MAWINLLNITAIIINIIIIIIDICIIIDIIILWLSSSS